MPSTFELHARDFRWFPDDGVSGLRDPQRAALHAVLGHFGQSSDPALVVMPTGSGKTAVLQAVPYASGAGRVLVLTPSRLVREQIAHGFAQLDPLRRLGVLDSGVVGPRVYASRGRVAPEGGWEALRAFDVVVGTPQSLSPVIRDVPVPPDDLFDLVLVDEAHHSAARSWKALLDALPAARQVLFTATPFRRDRNGLTAKIVFTYSLRAALRDGVFGQLTYQPIVPDASDADPEVALARAAAATLRADHACGFDHRLMVRTGTKARANALLALYQHETDLRLQLVTGAQGLRHVTRVLRDLRTGALDGIVCVDMLAEGVDLPQLKVAALHTPHRSLAVALQFVGRFARTTAPNTGRATFFALASDMEVERTRLYAQGAGWDEMIPNLSDGRVARERETQAILGTFTAARMMPGQGLSTRVTAQMADVSLRSLMPYHHVKVLRVGADVDVTRTIQFPNGTEVVFSRMSAEQHTAVYILRTATRAEWTTDVRFDGVDHDLLVVYADRPTGLLFLCATNRTPSFYRHLAEQYAVIGGPTPRGLPLSQLNKVLLDLRDTRLYHLGMRSAIAGNRTESYRSVAGSAVEQSVDPTHGRKFRRGHYMGSAVEAGEKITIGVSTASKVWQNAATPIPDLIYWCKRVARKLVSDRVPWTNTGLDHLATGDEATRVPEGVVYADWHPTAYETPLRVRYTTADGRSERGQLLDLALQVEDADADTVRIALVGDAMTFRATFRLHDSPHFIADSTNTTDVLIDGGREDRSVLSYLNSYPPTFYTAEFASLEGRNVFPAQAPDLTPFDRERIEVIDWAHEGIDIREEIGPPGGTSIHAYLERRLLASDAAVVVYDHAKGEMADFIAFTERAGMVRVALYHAKKSGGPRAGSRLDDASEVCSQTIKSTHWAERRRILDHVHARLRRPGSGTRFVKGDWAGLLELLGDGVYRPLVLEIVVVQPGFSASGLSTDVLAQLAAAEAFVMGGRCDRIQILGSA
jgi:superfamily II DNA or RNA helicase